MPRAYRSAKATESGPLVFNHRSLQKNDHIYVSAPWEDRDGEPYLVGRILEILQPATAPPAREATPSTSKDRKLIGPDTSKLRLRVNYYFRTRDISNRYVADHRVLVASFHSDVVPAEYVRGTCTVMHREHIENLEKYKRQPDTFYWHQLYDRYLHRYFDSVPTYKVKNAPPDIVKHLNENFEFVLCEVGTGGELSDAQRGCCVCSRWAANPESVTCARCARVFHLNCLDPPLAAKPKAGYAWSCAPCTLAHDEEVEGYAETGFGPPPVRKAAEGFNRVHGMYDPKAPQVLSQKGKGKAREVEAGVRTDPREWHTMNGWPFRYFGMHTNAYSVLDPHDSLFPRVRTRLGNKFQCNVPLWDPATGQQEAPPEQRVYFQPKRSRASTPMGRGEKDKEKEKEKKTKRAKQNDVPPRGEEEAIQVIWRSTTQIDESILDDLFYEAKRLKAYSNAGVDLLNRAVQLIVTNDGNVPATIAALRKVTLSSMGHASWNEEERRKLAEGAEQHSNDIAEIASHIDTKKMSDVVKRYYVHIGHKLQEDEPTQPEEKVAAATRSVRRAPSQSKKRTRAVARDEAADEEDDDNGSVCGQPTSLAQKRNRFCAICAETTSKKWYYCPDNVCELDVKPSPLVMCEDCGIRYRHYGAQYPPYGDELKPVPTPKQPTKKELERIAAEEARLAEAAAAAIEAAKPKEPTPPPPKPVIQPKPCLLCKRYEPKTTRFQCDNCTLSVHAACYGLPEGEVPYEEWLCDICDREKRRKPLVLHPHCVLCPPPLPKHAEETGPAPLTALELMKPTELNNYVHLLCAVWHRELLLGEPSVVSPVEGFPLLPRKRITEKCFICKNSEIGCTVKCEDCDKHFHVSCAWASSYKFAFEVQAVQKKKRPPKDLVTVKFKEEEGQIFPCIWCPDHHFSHAERKTYDLGARDQASKLTALQMYVRTSKVPKNRDAPLPLRQGRRLDAIVEPVLKPKPPAPPPPPPPRPSRVTRPSLLSAVIEETAPPAPSRSASKPPARKRRTESALAREPFYEPEPQYEMAFEAMEPLPALPVEEAPLPSKRIRNPPKRFELDSPQPVKKATKKRRTGSYVPNDAAYFDDLSYEAASAAGPRTSNSGDFAALPALPAATPLCQALPTVPVLPDLPQLPSFSESLPPLPSFTSDSLQQPGAFADAFYPNDLQLEPFLYPELGNLPNLPHLGSTSSGLDPAFEALTNVAAAAADARLELPDFAPSFSDAPPASASYAEPSGTSYANGTSQVGHSQAYVYSLPASMTTDGYSVTATAQAPIDDGTAPQGSANGEAASAEDEQDAESGNGNGALSSGNEAPSVSTTATTPPATESAPAQEAVPPPSGPVPTQSAPSDADAVAPAPVPSAATPSAPLVQQPLPPTSQSDTHTQSPAVSHDPLSAYMRTQEASAMSSNFRIETPDTSDGASAGDADRFDSPATTQAGLPEPVGYPPLPPLPSFDLSALPAPPMPSTSTAHYPQFQETPQRPRNQKRPSVKGHSSSAVCGNCGTSDSPLFRRDDQGRQLCNSCGLYYKTHGHDRPRKVIDRGIGAARVQKRKAQADDSPAPNSASSSAKRARSNGTPLPLQQLPYSFDGGQSGSPMSVPSVLQAPPGGSAAYSHSHSPMGQPGPPALPPLPQFGQQHQYQQHQHQHQHQPYDALPPLPIPPPSAQQRHLATGQAYAQRFQSLGAQMQSQDESPAQGAGQGQSDEDSSEEDEGEDDDEPEDE
ncbi:hypothetical protein JCM11641_004472 [Rhodosporidiobolus odoratus]